MRLLMWVSKSRKKLAAALAELGHSVCPNSVGKLLGKLGYSRQGKRKTLEGRQHADRDAQFRHINARVQAAQSAGEPVISVDTKKKELVGRFKNAGTDYRPQGEPDPVDVHDFPDKKLGKVVPYGIYDVAEDEGWVSLGITHDTAEFAVHAIERWHERMGRARYPNAERLLITADFASKALEVATLDDLRLRKISALTVLGRIYLERRKIKAGKQLLLRSIELARRAHFQLEIERAEAALAAVGS